MTCLVRSIGVGRKLLKSFEWIRASLSAGNVQRSRRAVMKDGVQREQDKKKKKRDDNLRGRHKVDHVYYLVQV